MQHALLYPTTIFIIFHVTFTVQDSKQRKSADFPQFLRPTGCYVSFTVNFGIFPTQKLNSEAGVDFLFIIITFLFTFIILYYQ